jgi:hypothetical protein
MRQHQLTEGMTVYSADNHDLGQITRLWPARPISLRDAASQGICYFEVRVTLRWGGERVLYIPSAVVRCVDPAERVRLFHDLAVCEACFLTPPEPIAVAV